MKTRCISLMILLSLALGSCGVSQADGQGEDLAPSVPLEPPSQDPLSTPVPDLPSQGDNTAMPATTPAAASLQNLIEKAKQDLVQRSNIQITQINLIETKAVVWRDASLGCPKPGIDYIRVETQGYIISLGAGGKTYNYHTDQGKRIVLCDE